MIFKLTAYPQKFLYIIEIENLQGVGMHINTVIDTGIMYFASL